MNTAPKALAAVRAHILAKFPFLPALFGVDFAPVPYFWRFRRFYSDEKAWTAMVVWGKKSPYGAFYEAKAREKSLPVWRLEDGFLRSIGIGVSGAQPLSLVLDRTGIYYDATAPSDLENLLAGVDPAGNPLDPDPLADPGLLAEAREAMAEIRRHRLSKYNHAPDLPPGTLAARARRPDAPRILVIDQTAGDMSVPLGLAGADTFARMLQAALDEHPDADLFVKTHPDVLAGYKKGYLTDLRVREPRVHLMADDCSPLSLLEQVDEVYAVTSQMGFDGAMLGKTVHCFGMPFYAGWGVTRDRLACPRRRRRRSVEEVFAAAYCLYARYLDPVDNQPSTVLRTIRLLSARRGERLPNP